ncbi:MAG: hypothetical protein IKP53_08285 [Candidatus Methanomethylophilaceae archaeon]|nr:hypothetical protein [Candidatus Methanomethylophilaceae archaeon]
MTGHSAADVKAANDYLRRNMDLLEAVVKEYDSGHEMGIPMTISETEELFGLIASRDPTELFDLGATTGETWGEIFGWQYIAYDGESLYEADRDDLESRLLAALKRYPIAEWVLEGNSSHYLGELEGIIDRPGAASRNARRPGRRPGAAAKRKAATAKRKAPARKAPAKRRTAGARR